MRSQSLSNFDVVILFLNAIVAFFWRHTTRCWRKSWEFISPPSTADEYRHFTDFEYKKDDEELEIGSSEAKGTYSPPTFIPFSQGYEEPEITQKFPEKRHSNSFLEENKGMGKVSMYYSTIESPNSSYLDQTVYYDVDEGSEPS